MAWLRRFFRRIWTILATPAGTLTVRQEGKTGFGDGATVHVTPLADQVHRFDETGQRLD